MSWVRRGVLIHGELRGEEELVEACAYVCASVSVCAHMHVLGWNVPGGEKSLTLNRERH